MLRSDFIDPLSGKRVVATSSSARNGKKSEKNAQTNNVKGSEKKILDLSLYLDPLMGSTETRPHSDQICPVDFVQSC